MVNCQRGALQSFAQSFAYRLKDAVAIAAIVVVAVVLCCTCKNNNKVDYVASLLKLKADYLPSHGCSECWFMLSTFSKFVFNPPMLTLCFHDALSVPIGRGIRRLSSDCRMFLLVLATCELLFPFGDIDDVEFMGITRFP